MADEPETSDDAKAAPKKGSSSLIPIILAVIVLLGAGVGVGLFLASTLWPAEAPKQEEKIDENSSSIDPMKTKEITIGDLITNISNQDGRRYVKVTCAIWMGAEDVVLVQGAGGEGEIQVKRLMQMGLEEQLKRYELADLTGRGIIAALTQDFSVVLEDILHAQFPSKPKEHRFVKKVLLNNLLVQ
jgi:hypothetical protein